jgi:cobalt-precorrin-7 (C5)-methyltransferase
MKDNERTIFIVGCGPGSPEFLTLAALNAIQGAEVIVGAKRLLELVPEGSGERIAVDADINRVLDEIEKHGKTKTVAVLVTGDPGIFSLARPVIERFGRERCCVIPGVSSLQEAFARLSLEWHDAKIIDAHGADPQEDMNISGDKIAVFAGRKESCIWAARLGKKLGDGYRTFLCEDLTLPGERVREITPDDLLKENPSSRSIIIFVRKELLQ